MDRRWDFRRDRGFVHDLDERECTLRGVAGQASSSLREANRQALVAELRVSGPTSRAELARRSGLAKQTVSTIVADLLADGVVREVGRGVPEPGGGRPGTLVEYAADRSMVVGVELGVGRMRVTLADALGVPVAEQELSTGRGRRRRPAVEVLDEVVASVVSAAGEDGLRRLRAVGVSVTGLVQPSTGTCVLAANLGWRRVPVAELLRARLEDVGVEVPVLVRNAAQASLIAEHRLGAAMGHDDVVLVFEDEGVGAAVIERGRLLDGADGTAGELCHCTWPGAGARCGCGRRGCVETVASGPAVRRAVERAGGRRLRPRNGVPTFAALSRLHAPEVDEAAADAGRVLGTAASWLVALTAPRLVVLSGSLVDAPPPLRSALEAAVRGAGLPHQRPRVVTGTLGDSAALRGATLLALDQTRSAPPRWATP